MVLATLLFMFYLSWRLSLVAFVSVPTIVVVSRYYGVYIRELSKLSQVNRSTREGRKASADVPMII